MISGRQKAARNPVPDRRAFQEADPVIERLARIPGLCFRFIASLELAVFSLVSLVSVLAYATFFESWYGVHAAQEWIYRSCAFTALLAVLCTNILGAALVRFQWNEHQRGWKRAHAGFVITHAGLLILLLGSWITLQTADAGQVMLREGQATDQVVRTDHSVIRLQELDPTSGRPLLGRTWEFAFEPGAFSWNAGNYVARKQPAPRTGVIRRDILTGPFDDVRLVVKDFIVASSPPIWLDDAGDAQAAVERKKVYQPLELSGSQAEAGIPACLIELHVKDDSRELWLRRQADIDDPIFEPVVVAGHRYRLAFDFDRRPLGFELSLVDFNIGTDPGAEEPSSYTSRVIVNDLAQGADPRAAAIAMNAPLRHRGRALYQHSYRELRDPQTGRVTGEKASVLQVAIDPYWGIKYVGCLIVVLGTLVQFSTRNGVFSVSRGQNDSFPAQAW
jgi:hypothetical protein